MFITTKRFINKFPFDSFTLKRKYKTTKKKNEKEKHGKLVAKTMQLQDFNREGFFF